MGITIHGYGVSAGLLRPAQKPITHQPLPQQEAFIAR
jgi:hypothetical protein